MLNKKRGFSLAEVGIALVIVLIISTVAMIGYFFLIDNSKEVTMVNNSKKIKESIIRSDLMDHLNEFETSLVEEDIRKIASLVKEPVVLSKKILETKEGYRSGELKTNEIPLEEGLGKYYTLDFNKSKNYFSNITKEVTDEFIVFIPFERETAEDEEDDFISLTCEEALQEGYDYCISNGQELSDVRNDTSARYILINNIDLSDFNNWDPIGSYTNRFIGELNGNGYKISNLKINRPGQMGVGLFAVAGPATFKNIRMENYLVEGGEDTGGLVGYLNWSGEDKNFSLIDSSFEGTVINTGGDSYVGGVFGNSFIYNESLISNVTINTVVNAVDSYYVGLFSGYSEMYDNTMVENIRINGNLEVSYVGGGFVGWFETYDDIIISNVDIELDVNTKYGAVGLFVGHGWLDDNERINDIKVKGKINPLINATELGGFSGVSDMFNTTNIYNIESEVDIVGGDIIGLFSGELNIMDDSLLSNVVLKGSVDGKENIGGFVGEFGSSDGSFISNVEINSQVNGTENVGGLFGVVNSFNEGLDLDNITLTSEVNGENSIGLISGYMYPRLSGNMFKLNNLNLEGSISGIEFVGGLFGVTDSVRNRGSLPYDVEIRNSSIYVDSITRISGDSGSFGKIRGHSYTPLMLIDIDESVIINNILFKSTPDSEGSTVFPYNL